MSDNRDRAAAMEGAATIVSKLIEKGQLNGEQAEEWAFRLARALYAGPHACSPNARIKTFDHYQENFGLKP